MSFFLILKNIHFLLNLVFIILLASFKKFPLSCINYRIQKTYIHPGWVSEKLKYECGQCLAKELVVKEGRWDKFIQEECPGGHDRGLKRNVHQFLWGFGALWGHLHRNLSFPVCPSSCIHNSLPKREISFIKQSAFPMQVTCPELEHLYLSCTVVLA